MRVSTVVFMFCRKHVLPPKSVVARQAVGVEKAKNAQGGRPALRVRITVVIGAWLIDLFVGEGSLLQESRNFVQEPLFEVAHCGA